ncbi:beta-carotene 15,15'-dioxygenase, Brp/Blh family [Mucilaginibacter robiniae]|uniref:Probable beta-carotene 15,15'-dioxygenase n=1 Tax=Mucilaginibacter robiniae TaxID=2728022 RepID=A0A7L5E5A0_9SPHI|nr:Brp/Blh family beta-carotene 15,15'-dioxygenase [Mucilaginibacter robiniae]QJD97798.1 beta-carotene 15,15'-dioxygenase, Brp/Blh family [Mucilaginibacter robiniae]
MAQSNPYTLQNVKLVCFTVVAGILLTVWQLIDGCIPLPMQLVFLMVSLLLTGIPHGALDHLVQQEQSRRQQGRFRLMLFLGRYVAIMLLYALAWYVFPQLSLSFFLLISCWHFGETDISLMPQTPVLTALLRLLYGISVLVWILLPHQFEVSPILLHMVTRNGLIYSHWTAIASNSSWLIPASSMVILVASIVTAFIRQGNRYCYWLRLQLVVVLLCGYALPLLPAFALYFAGWHSLITLFNIKGFITDGNTTHNKPLLILWLKALPFSLIAITGLVAAGYSFRRYAPLFDPLPLLFVFLSLITLPHMEVMHKLNSSVPG